MSVSEIFLNLGNLSNEIIKQIWFTEIRDYINLRYDALINRFKKTFDYSISTCFGWDVSMC